MDRLDLLDVIQIKSEGDMDSFNMISDLLTEEDGLELFNKLDNPKELAKDYSVTKDINKVKEKIRKK